MACHCFGSAFAARVAPTSRSFSPVTRKPLRVSSCARSLACTAARLSLAEQPNFQSCRSSCVSAQLTRQSARQRRQVLTQAYNQKPDIADRVVASVPYLIPLCDGLRYGMCADQYGLCNSSCRSQPCLFSREIFLCPVSTVCSTSSTSKPFG